MSLRAILDTTSGLRVSKPGFDANSAAVKDMLLTPANIMLRVYSKGIIAAGAGSIENISGVPSIWNNRYRKIDVSYGKTFDAPPIVQIAPILSTGEAAHIYWSILGGTVVSGTPRTRFEPMLFSVSFTNRMEIWSLLNTSAVPSYFYVILENLV